ncbi:MAG: sulfatase-like hydrolase/transferase [Candidatus Eisenbacteria bacterium]
MSGRGSEAKGAGAGPILWLLSGMTLGAAAGLADGMLLTRVVRSITLPNYLVLMTTLQYAILGASSGLLFGILSRLLPSGSLRRRPFALLVPVTLFILLVTIGNRFFLPGESDPSSIAFDLVLLVLCVLLVALFARDGARRPPPALRRAGALRLGATAAIILAAAFASRERPGAGAGEKKGGASGPNLIILMIDTLRNDHVSWSGYGRATTPALDRIAGEGTILTGLVTQAPHTKASCASLLTSLYPASHTAVGNSGLPRSALTLAEVLGGAGYRTFGASANTFITPVFGFDQGFDRLVTLPLVTATKNEVGYLLQRICRRFGRSAPAEWLLDRMVDFEQRWFWSVHPEVSELSASQVIEPFLEWLGEGSGREPFFAYLHFLEPHSLYDPPPPFDAKFAGDYRGESVVNHPPTAGLFSPKSAARPLPEPERRNMVDRYDGEILYLDGEIARLVERLRKSGVSDRSLLVIVADHGETFYEHGMWGHGHSLFDEELRVPLAVVMPGRIPAGGRIDGTVRIVDLMPTFLDLLGVPAPAGLQGESFAGLLEAGRGGEDRPAYSEIEWSGWRYDSLRKDGFKLIRGPGGPWLFDLVGDPGEKENLAGTLPEKTAEFLAEIDALRSAFEGARLDRQGEEEALDETTVERLRALGYIQ